MGRTDFIKRVKRHSHPQFTSSASTISMTLSLKNLLKTSEVMLAAFFIRLSSPSSFTAMVQATTALMSICSQRDKQFLTCRHRTAKEISSPPVQILSVTMSGYLANYSSAVCRISKYSLLGLNKHLKELFTRSLVYSKRQ